MKRWTEIVDGVQHDIVQYDLVSKERRADGWWCRYENGDEGLVPLSEAEKEATELVSGLWAVALELICKDKS